MTILALDASTKNTGWALFDSETNKLLEYGCINSSSTDLIKRINIMKEGISAILDKYPKIEKIILEEVRPQTEIGNIKTFKALIYLQAAIVFLIHEKGNKQDIKYLYPSSWRKQCGIKTGKSITRDILKKEDIKFVNNFYHLNLTNDDIADAIGIGHAYLYDHSLNEKEIEGINWG